jgi:2-oxoglutarate dehydrogenase E1 component
MYKKIDAHPPVREIYQATLMREGIIHTEDLEEKIQDVRRCIEHSYEEAQQKKFRFEPDVPLAVSEEELAKVQPVGPTGVDKKLLHKVMQALTMFPENFKVHPKLEPQFKKRQQLFFEDNKVDWALAEALAFGTLLCDGTPLRLCGQDSTRGTFSQRHLVLADLNTGQEYVPLNNITQTQAKLQAFDSLLSEAAVLGFEFGYSVADPLTLVIWEAQFGDFANGAQTIIDNFIASAEAKWQQKCDLVMLLPHGFEGQGPEHSSARLERFLQLCAENNLQVCNCSTPAQYFHVLRRQMRDAVRKPLIVMTPKSLLRHPLAVSTPEDLSEGRFHEVLDDPTSKNKSAVKGVLLCSGKVYYDLYQYRKEEAIEGFAIIRLEQFYPFPDSRIIRILESYTKARDVFWVQEEPKNMGAWTFLKNHLFDELPSSQMLRYIGRPESASPATGNLKTHKQEQSKLVREAFRGKL